MYDFLITGASGFIGKNIVDFYKNKKLLLILRKKNNFTKNRNIKKIIINSELELHKKLKDKQFKNIIHCATHFTKDNKIDDITKTVKSNILLGSYLLEIIKDKKVNKFINFTTNWENYDGIKDKSNSFYTTTKQCFTKILNFYKKKYSSTKFYNLHLTDTYGKYDNRPKIIKTIKKNIKLKKKINIVSKNLFMNILNVKDVILAVNKIITSDDIVSGDYILKNKNNFKIKNIIDILRIRYKKKIKVKYFSHIKMYPKIYNLKKIPNWKPVSSTLKNLVGFINANNKN